MIDFTNFDQKASPKCLEQIAFESHQDFQQMKSLISGKYGFPSSSANGILLHGTAGSGKSTLARMLPDLFEKTDIGLNSPWRNEFTIFSSANGVSTLGVINQLCSSSNLVDKYTYIILHEVDNLTAPAMEQLKSVMENHVNRAIFIFTTNNVQKIEKSVLDRCYRFSFESVPNEAWIEPMQYTLKAYGIDVYTTKQLSTITPLLNGSGRQFAKVIKRLIESHYKSHPAQLPEFLKS